MFRYLSAILAVVVLVTSGCGCRRRPAWTYEGKLHNVIAAADRVVVIDAGFDCYGQDSKAKTLVELSKPDEARQFAEHIEFEKGQTTAVCPCNGYPRIDWYKGKDRLATVSIQHGQAIRWKGFQADAKLTSKSSQWLRHWLADHGVDPAKMK
jgi:hypothetical protein